MASPVGVLRVAGDRSIGVDSCPASLAEVDGLPTAVPEHDVVENGRGPRRALADYLAGAVDRIGLAELGVGREKQVSQVPGCVPKCRAIRVSDRQSAGVDPEGESLIEQNHVPVGVRHGRVRHA